MSNIGSLPTGQMSMQAPQAVQAHTADSLMGVVEQGRRLRAGGDGLGLAVESRSAC